MAKYHVFSLYSKSNNSFNLPFFCDDDADAIAYVARMVTSQADPALMASLDDLQLFSLGSFMTRQLQDHIKPLWSVDDPVLILDDLHKNLPLPPMIKAAVDKYYGGTQNA